MGRRRGASARSGLEGLPLRSKFHEDVMHVFWCSRPVLEACQGLSEAQSPKRDLQPPESVGMCLLNSLATAVRRAQGLRFLEVASTRQPLRLFSDLEVQHASGNAASDM